MMDKKDSVESGCEVGTSFVLNITISCLASYICAAVGSDQSPRAFNICELNQETDVSNTMCYTLHTLSNTLWYLSLASTGATHTKQAFPYHEMPRVCVGYRISSMLYLRLNTH